MASKRRRLAKREMRQVKSDRKAVKRAVRAHQRAEGGRREA